MKLSAVIFATLCSLASAQTSPSSSVSSSSSSLSSAHPASSSSSSPSSAVSASPSSAQSSAPSSGSGGAIISVTAPLQGASYKAGDKAIISWINPTVESISQIVLAKGGSNSLQPVSTIATNVLAASGSYTWNIPADTPAGSDYAFEFGTSPNLAFTGQFSITGGSGDSVTSPGTNATSPVAGSGASSASPASGSSNKPLTGSASGAAQASPSSSAATTLTAGSVAVIGAVIITLSQVF